MPKNTAPEVEELSTTPPARDYKAERDYLWDALAKIEAQVAEAAPYVAGHIAKKRLAEALDGFMPAAVVTRVMP